MLLFTICTISIKNAWISASNLNNSVFSSIKPHLTEKLVNKPIFVLFNKSININKDNFFTLSQWTSLIYLKIDILF